MDGDLVNGVFANLGGHHREGKSFFMEKPFAFPRQQLLDCNTTGHMNMKSLFV